MLQPFCFKTFVKIHLHTLKLFCLVFFAIIIQSCTSSSKKSDDNELVLAKVNKTTLTITELSQFTPQGISKADSIILLKKYINKWANDELFYQEALNYLTVEDIDIEKEIENYRKELITYKFQTKLITEKLDTLLTQSEIESYYNKNAKNFLLKNNIVKVLYVKTPASIPNLDKLKKLCYSNNLKDAQQLNALCIQYANNYYTNNNTWLMFDDLKKEIPQLKEVPEYNLQNGKIFEFNDAKNYYFLKIIEIKSKNTLSPINFERNNIKAMLLNERKKKLINSIKQDFFEKAKANKQIEIYN